MNQLTKSSRRRYLSALIALSSPVRLAFSKVDAISLLDQAQRPIVLEQAPKRWLLINLWATWCPPCLEEIPDLVSLYHRRSSIALNVVGVAYDWPATDPTHELVEKIRRRLRMNYPIVPASPSNMKWFGPEPSIPSSVLIRPNGKVHALHRGALTDAMVLAAIRK